MREIWSSSDLLFRTALNLGEFFVGGARDSGQRHRYWDDLAVSDRLIADAMANSAVLLQPMNAANVDEMCDRLITWYGATGSSWILWSAWPTPDLTPSGLHPVGNPPLMQWNPDSPRVVTPPELEISEVTAAEGLRLFNRTFGEGYPVEHRSSEEIEGLFGAGMLGGANRFWNGSVGGRVVSVSSACVSHGIVTVNAIATRADARGRGYGAAMTAVATTCEPDLPVYLLASDLGRPVYERIGYRQIGEFTLWHGSGRLPNTE